MNGRSSISMKTNHELFMLFIYPPHLQYFPLLSTEVLEVVVLLFKATNNFEISYPTQLCRLIKLQHLINTTFCCVLKSAQLEFHRM